MHVQQRALPRPALADDRDHLAAFRPQIHAVEDVQRAAVPAAVRLRDVVGFEHVHRHRVSSLVANRFDRIQPRRLH